MRGRIDAAGRFVVFQTFIGPPPRTNMLKKFDAFALILEKCGYEAVWRHDDRTLTLSFRLADGATAPESFDAELRFGIASDQDLMLSKVFEAGLKGWRALPSDMFSILRGIEEQKHRGARPLVGLEPNPAVGRKLDGAA
jgi:hypothetical protein